MKNNEKIRENSDDFMAICTNGPFLGVIIAVLAPTRWPWNCSAV